MKETARLPRRPNKKVQRYGDHEERLVKIIKDLKSSPESKTPHIAAHGKLSEGHLEYNRYYGRTQSARAAHPEERTVGSRYKNSRVIRIFAL